ncbi:hypothetical protein ACWG8W_06160 [Citricoccus zhacaiensis]
MTESQPKKSRLPSRPSWRKGAEGAGKSPSRAPLPEGLRKLISAPKPRWLREIERSEAYARTAYTSTSTDQLAALIAKKDVSEETKLAALGNPFYPVDLLVAATQSDDRRIRFIAAGNPAMPVAELERLATDDACIVRAGVGGNPSTPAHVLEVLATDDDHDSEPQEEQLLPTGPEVRRAVAFNPSTPAHVLAMLMEETNCHQAIARHSNTPEALLQELATSEYTWVVADVASNPNTSRRLLTRLHKDADHFDVHKALASNPNTPTGILRAYVGERGLAAAAAGNPSTPSDALGALASRTHVNPDTYFLLRNLLENPATPAEAMERIAAENKKLGGEISHAVEYRGGRGCSRSRTEQSQRQAREDVLVAWNAEQSQG